MRFLGSLLRALLNINTVWGLMILSAFVLCVAQQYLPTTTAIPAAQLKAGANTLTIRTRGQGGKVDSFEYQLTAGPQGLAIPPEQQAPRQDCPWLISATPAEGGVLLKWDHAGHGEYEVAVNGSAVGHGSLIRLQSLTDAAFDYAKRAFDIALGLVATMVLFLGLMKVGEDAGIVQLAARAFHPVMRLIWPGIPKDHPAGGAVLMNITTGVLGLGNAATPFGLKAMKELQTLNPHPEVATDAQVTLLAWNTGGLALLPVTLLAVRKAAGCKDPFEVIGTCLLAGAVSTTVAVIAARLLGKLRVFSVKAALAEQVPAAVDAVAAPPERQEAGS